MPSSKDVLLAEAANIRRIVNGYAYDTSTADLLVERWPHEFDDPYVWCERLYQTAGGARFLLYLHEADPESPKLTPLDHQQALAWAEKNCGAAEIERLFGPQPEAIDETGREQISFLISKADKAKVSAAGKTLSGLLQELFQHWRDGPTTG